MGIKLNKVQVFFHSDKRRTIRDVTLPEGMGFPFIVRQFKTITLSNTAVKQGLAIGNHYHTMESHRWEFYVVVGEEDFPLFRFRFRGAGEKDFHEQEMTAGDACIIPPMHSHAFLALRPGVQLFGFSDCPYRSEDDVLDKLF